MPQLLKLIIPIPIIIQFKDIPIIDPFGIQVISNNTKYANLKTFICQIVGEMLEIGDEFLLGHFDVIIVAWS